MSTQLGSDAPAIERNSWHHDMMTTRVILAVRKVVRDTVWTARGFLVRNPPLPPGVRSILFICKGNICRSPFAAYLADRICAELKLAVTCHSAGIVPSSDGRCPPEATRAAIRYGVRLADHVPVGLNRRLAAAHDLIVVMEAGQSTELRRMWPDLSHRLVLLAPFGQSGNDAGDAYSRLNISDPFGKEAAVFDACYGRIECAVRRLLELMKSGGLAASLHPGNTQCQ